MREGAVSNAGVTLRRRATTVLGSVAAAVGLGIYADRGHLLDAPLDLVTQLGLPWLVLAFVGGRLMRRRLVPGAMAGVALIVVGLGSYVVWKVGIYGAYSVGELRYGGASWLILAGVLGSVFGIAGALTNRDGRWLRAWGWGALVAVAIVESIAVLIWFPASHAVPIGVVEMLVGILIALVAFRETDWWRLAIGVGVASAVGLAGAWIVYGL